MIYVALIFCALFTAFFVWETKKSLDRGVVKSRGSTWARADRPLLFWSGIGAWIVNALAGAAFTIGIASILIGRSS